jgi:hypothetical protein
MGIKGEPAKGLVWSAIVGQVDRVGSESEWVSVVDTPRDTFGKHPWSIGGGGAADLKEMLEEGREPLWSQTDAIGVMVVTGEDDVFARSEQASFRQCGIPASSLLPLVVGDVVRDWGLGQLGRATYEYTSQGTHKLDHELDSYFWVYRALIVR